MKTHLSTLITVCLIFTACGGTTPATPEQAALEAARSMLTETLDIANDTDRTFYELGEHFTADCKTVWLNAVGEADALNVDMHAYMKADLAGFTTDDMTSQHVNDSQVIVHGINSNTWRLIDGCNDR